MKKFLSSCLVFMLVVAPLSTMGFVFRVNVPSLAMDPEGEANAFQSESEYTYIALSSKGRYSAFVSPATNLVNNDRNEHDDIFVNDRRQKTTIMATSKTDSTPGVYVTTDPQANRICGFSENERYVFFQSEAINLVAGDSNGAMDVFRKDLISQETVLVSKNDTGTPGNQGSHCFASQNISLDGRYVLFESAVTNLHSSSTAGQRQVFLKDLQTGTVTVVSSTPTGTAGNYTSTLPWSYNVMSSDGRFVLLTSQSTNLVSSDSNNARDVFRKDRQNGAITRVSVDNEGGQANGDSNAIEIDRSGRYALFKSTANNLAGGDSGTSEDLFVRDTVGNTTSLVNIGNRGVRAEFNELPENNPGIMGVKSNGDVLVMFTSEDGEILPSREDSNGLSDVFVRNITQGTTTRVSLTSAGVELDGPSVGIQLSQNGRYVLFRSNARYLPPGNARTQLYIRDLTLNTTTRVTANSHRTRGTRDDNEFVAPLATMTSNGRYVLFSSSSNELRDGDLNDLSDIFLKQVFDGLKYDDPAGEYNFYYPKTHKYKPLTDKGALSVIFTDTGAALSQNAPMFTVAKAPRGSTLRDLYTSAVSTYSKLIREDYTVSTENERTADGIVAKQIQFTGKQAAKSKTYSVAFIKKGATIYVVSANGLATYAEEVDDLADIIINTFDFN